MSPARRRVAAVLVSAGSLCSCGMVQGHRSSPSRSTPMPTLPSLTGLPAGGGTDTSPQARQGSSGAEGEPLPAGTAAGAATTETIGFDVLAPGSVVDPEQIGALAYGVEAAADPFRIVVTADEQACLSRASVGLSDDQIDDALAWDEASGDFGADVAECLTAANREAFAVWHQIDTDLAEASDEQYRCVEQGIAEGATRQHLAAALVACGLQR